MRFTLMITGPTYGTQQATSAYQFAKALLTTKHILTSVFFYRDGVYNANSFSSPASDEIDLVRDWYKLYKQHNVALYLCATAALRRGVISTVEAKRTGLLESNLQKGFLLTGLNTLAMEILTCDRLVQF